MFTGGNSEVTVIDMSKGGKKSIVGNGNGQGKCTEAPFTGDSLWKLC